MPVPVTFNAVVHRSQNGAVIPQALRSVSIDLTCTLPHAELAKLYRTIETALPGSPNRVVQFVSAYKDEGANTIAFETAIVAAKLIGKRVLFIDTSAVQRSVQGKLPGDAGVPLDTLLLTGRPPHEAIAQAAGTDLYFAMLHAHGDDGFAAASLSAMERALANLRPTFDLIVVDSQSILTDAFGMALAKLVDGSILVIEAERTRAPVVLESRRMIEASGGRVIGAILNRRRFYIPKFVYRLLYPHATL